MKIPAYLKFLFFVLLISFWGCGDEKSTNPPPDSDPDTRVEVPPQEDPLEKTRQKIQGILTNYYHDLEREQLDESLYFAPTVRQFFSSTDVPREQVGKSLENGFKNIEDRKVNLDMTSLAVKEENGGFVAEFKGETSFTRTNTREKVSQPFANRIHFNDAFQIIRYQAMEEPAADNQNTRALTARSAVAEVSSMAQTVLNEFKTGKFETTPQYIHAGKGFYLIGAPGAYRVPYHMKNFEEIFTHGPWFREGLPIENQQPVAASLPKFDCGDLFSKEGCFIEEISNYDNISTLMEALIKAEFDIFNAQTIAQAKSIEKMVEVAVVETGASLALYFGQNGGKWYLLVVDIATYDCSA